MKCLLLCLLFTYTQVCVFAENSTSGPEYEPPALDIMNNFFRTSSNPGGEWHQPGRSVTVPFGITYQNENHNATLVLSISGTNLNPLFGHVSVFRIRRGSVGYLEDSYVSAAPFSFVLMPTQEEVDITFAGDATLNMIGETFGPYQVSVDMHRVFGTVVKAEYITGLESTVNINFCKLFWGGGFTVKYLDDDVAHMLRGFTTFLSSRTLAKEFENQIMTQINDDLSFSMQDLRQLVRTNSLGG
ncbi:hypothetical protein HDE_06657 [Halotydeus destructor]|nr:hypothetical protein HDE_06657 [Halotydeus destructor]